MTVNRDHLLLEDSFLFGLLLLILDLILLLLLILDVIYLLLLLLQSSCASWLRDVVGQVQLWVVACQFHTYD